MLISAKCYTLIWGVLCWIIQTCVLFNRVTATVMDVIIIYFPFFFLIRATFITSPSGTYDRLRQYRGKVGDLVFLTGRSHVRNFSWCTWKRPLLLPPPVPCGLFSWKYLSYGMKHSGDSTRLSSNSEISHPISQTFSLDQFIGVSVFPHDYLNRDVFCILYDFLLRRIYMSPNN